MIAAALAPLPTLGLAALVDEAELLTRVDRKYVLPRGVAAAAVAGADARTRVLEIDGGRAFSYASTYFDTPDLLSFRLAAHQRRRRFKLRTRSYLDTGGAYLEMKTRGSRATTVKERIPYDPADHARLTAAGRDYAAVAFAGLGIPGTRADELAPVLTTSYRRATLLLPGGSRVTIDTDLAWCDVAGVGFELPDAVIVETKSAERVSEIDRALWRAGHRPSRISKFATGLAALHPDLPRNRWARLLGDAFASATPIHPEENR